MTLATCYTSQRYSFIFSPSEELATHATAEPFVLSVGASPRVRGVQLPAALVLVEYIQQYTTGLGSLKHSHTQNNCATQKLILDDLLGGSEINEKLS